MDTHLRRFLHHLKVERGYSPNTLAAYERDLLQFQDFLTGIEVAVATLTSEELEDFVAELQAQGYKSATVARKVAALRAFLKFLYAGRGSGDRSFEWLHQPKTEKRLPRALSREQASDPARGGVCEDTPLGRATAHYWSCSTPPGMRASAVIAVALDDLDLAVGSVRCLGRAARNALRLSIQASCKSCSVT